ncbi:MAG: hypothetical protein M1377_04055 [Deltaproteobacteria bacterium]|nr:hypothetical protein [Deltaproteobacteria bacterium]
MRKVAAALFAMVILAVGVARSEIRPLGPYSISGLGVIGDLRLGNTCVTSAGGRTYCGLNASHLSFFADNTVSLERLYQLALVSDNGVAAYCLKSAGDNTFYWGACTGTVTSVTGDSMIGVATGTTTPALSLVDNSITSAKIQDNAISQRHIKFPTTNGYVRIFSPVASWVRYDMFRSSDDTVTSRFEMDDTGEIYIKSTRGSDHLFIGSLDFDPGSMATFLNGGAGTYLQISGQDNVIIDPPLYLTVPLGVASGGTGSATAAVALTNLGGDNASNLSLGTLPDARIGDNTITGTKIVDGTIASVDLADNSVIQNKIKFPVTGGYAKFYSPSASYARYGMLTDAGTVLSRFDLYNNGEIYLWATGAGSIDLDPSVPGMNISGVAGSRLLIDTFDTVEISSPAYLSAALPAPYDNSTKAATTAYVDQRYQYDQVNLNAPTLADNVIFTGPLPRARTLDNVIFLVQDNTGKLSGASTDNVTVNLSYCSNIATPTCTNVFASDQTATGAAILAPALDSTTPAEGDYMRVTFSAANMVDKKLYIRVRYHE